MRLCKYLGTQPTPSRHYQGPTYLLSYRVNSFPSCPHVDLTFFRRSQLLFPHSTEYYTTEVISTQIPPYTLLYLPAVPISISIRCSYQFLRFRSTSRLFCQHSAVQHRLKYSRFGVWLLISVFILAQLKCQSHGFFWRDSL
jgi:hypothetical protein